MRVPEVWERFEVIREALGDTAVLNEALCWLSGDEARDLADQIEGNYSLRDLEEDEEDA